MESKPPRNESGRDPGSDRRESPGRTRPVGLLLVALALGVIVAVAALTSDPAHSDVETNLYRATRYLVDGELDPGTFVFYKEKKLFRARRRGADALPAGEPREVAVHFVTDEEVDRFRREALDVYNDKAGGAADWEVRDAYFWELVLQPVLWISVILLVYFLFLRPLRSTGPGGQLFSFGRSRARVATRATTGVTFEHVAGVEEAKEEVREIIEFLRNPRRFQKLGGRIPRGVMLVGSPGTGKTLLAKAIAGEADVPFYSICGSDFVEMFVGVGASRVRDLFRRARESSPCIVFLDEVDAVGRRRGTGLGGGHDEREQTLNAILVEMDGFESDEGVILLAATNRPDVLDPALLRPGRFDREITLDLPDLRGREEILRVHAGRARPDPSVDFGRIARATSGFSGAELAALVNEAAIIAAMNDQDSIEEKDLEEARDKIRWGRSRRSRVFDDEDRRITAYHEAGHALVAHLLPEVEPLHRVTIIPRGVALGSTMQLPEKDRYHLSRKQLRGTLVLLYAGRVAEELFCGDVTAGAQNDIQRATELARRMVCEWGMSEELGPINYAPAEETLFLGREVTRSRHYSDDTARRIDAEVRGLVEESSQRARRLVETHRDAVDRIAKALLDRETLAGADVGRLLEGGPFERGEDGEASRANPAQKPPGSE